MLNGGLDGPFRHYRAKRTGIVSAVSTLASPGSSSSEQQLEVRASECCMGLSRQTSRGG